MFMDPHGPTIAPRCPTALVSNKITQQLNTDFVVQCHISVYSFFPFILISLHNVLTSFVNKPTVNTQHLVTLIIPGCYGHVGLFMH